MNIIIDGFGGDNAPLEVIKGSIQAIKNFDIEITVVGDQNKIKKCAKDNNIDISELKIKHASDIIEISDNPTDILKSKADSSMSVGMKMLANDEGDAFVSAGSTAALVVGGTFIVKRIKGVKRAALAPILPTSEGPFMIVDAGANSDCRPEMLQQWGIMGSAFMHKTMNIENPRVALANIGTEETKGRELELEAYKLLKVSPINFIGNVEARELPAGATDVIVADGYVGNMLLKLYEGMGKFISRELKGMLMTGFKSKLAALLILKKVKAFRKKMDYSEYGGSPLLGTSKPVIKAHGSSNAKAFYNAIRQAYQFTEAGVIGDVEKALSDMKNKK
ncbi:MAG: phosphate acyltransferase PlsX [Clostridiales bacterium]|nr:phosphate acyltransferase PlsX [Clostridiales bacterium]